MADEAPADGQAQKFNGIETCSSNGDYGNCLSGNEAAFCNCNNGVQYLDCVSAAITASTCVGAVGIADWDAYERSWFQSACPTPPSSVMSLLPQPYVPSNNPNLLGTQSTNNLQDIGSTRPPVG